MMINDRIFGQEPIPFFFNSQVDNGAISINQFKMTIWNNGTFWNPQFVLENNYSGDLLWPGGSIAYQWLCFANDFYFAATVDSTFRFSGGLLQTGLLRAGKVLDNGTADDSLNPRYRVYRIRKGWESTPFGSERDQLEKDYNEWPVEDGAPWVDKDGDGIFTRGVDQPDFVGDEVLFFVGNDINFPDSNYSSFRKPMNLEYQFTLYGFNGSGILGDAIFLKIKMINKQSTSLDKVYIGYQNQFESGLDWFQNKRAAGCDTLNDLGYCYFTINNDDYQYGESPPAYGTELLQCPITKGKSSDSALIAGKWLEGFQNIRMSSFYGFFQKHLGTIRGVGVSDTIYATGASGFFPISINQQFYNIFHGIYASGYIPITNPFTMQSTPFMVPGDPETNTSWTAMNWPENDSIPRPPHNFDGGMITTGPFTLAPFDTQEVVYGILAARGTDNLNSVTELKRRAAIIRKAYYLNFQLTPSPPSPVTFGFEQQGEVTLWWEPNAENYNEGDPFIYNQGYEDTTYTFEGYRIWQYRDTLSTDPRQLAVFDRTDGITVIEDYTIANGVSVKLPIIIGNDEGLRRQTTITTDAYTHEKLRNGSPYYFGVTAYGYSKNSSPAFLESKPKIVEVIPGRDKIDYSSPYTRGDEVLATQINGMSNADIIFRVVDPTRITGNSYRVDFSGPYDSLKYMLVNTTLGDTLFRNEDDYSADTLHRKVFDGFMVVVNNKGHKQIDSLPPSFQPYGIKRIVETRGPGGIPLDNPVDVYNSFNSTGSWEITSTGGIIQNIDVFNYIFSDDYELRFTQQGSQYYPFGFPTSNFLFGNNPKAADRVPFEIWNVTKGKRLNIKIQDLLIKDNHWSKDTTTNQWEKIYAYSTDYTEPIPSPSDTSDKINYPFGNLTIEGDLPGGKDVIESSSNL